MAKKLIEYICNIMLYTNQGEKFPSDCNSMYIKNNGQFTFFINGVYPVLPNTELRIEGNEYEINRTQFQVNFNAADVANGTQRCVVLRKYYADENLVISYLNGLTNGK